MLHLGYVGGLGLMAAPAAKHLHGSSEARVLRVHDRVQAGERRDACRAAWREHGAELVADLDTLVGAGDLDGIVVCCGKNGDDLPVIAALAQQLGAASSTARPFLLHMSTVSADFVAAAQPFCAAAGVDYVNYPLTGGPLGAELGGGHPNGMLILASGDEALYARLEPMLQQLGHPRGFGPRPAAGAEIKLIGQHMVFDGCIGICSAAALHAECFADGVLGGEAQAETFEFLNNGAGGTRQWQVALSKGVRSGVWDQGFLIRHAVVDAIYAAKLAADRGLPRLSVQPMLSIAFAFSFLLREQPGVSHATHSLARLLPAADASRLDAFMNEYGAWDGDLVRSLAACVASLPDDVAATAKLDICPADFECCT